MKQTEPSISREAVREQRSAGGGAAWEEGADEGIRWEGSWGRAYGGGGVLNLSSFDQDGLDGNEGSDEEEVTHAPLPV